MIKLLALIFSIAVFVVPSKAIAVEPLSCRVQVMLHVVIAMNRDVGASTQKARGLLNEGGELTQGEINQIIKNVYVKYKNKSKEEIASIIESSCK